MFKWLLERIKQASWFTRYSRTPNPKKLAFEEFRESIVQQRVKFAETLIENNDDFTEAADPSHPGRLLWNRTAYHLAEYYRDKLDLTKALHFYHKVKADSAYAVKAYYHLGTIYQYSFNNSQAGAYYFRLAKEKGDVQSGFLEEVARKNISPRELNKFENNEFTPNDPLTDLRPLQHQIYFRGETKMESKNERKDIIPENSILVEQKKPSLTLFFKSELSPNIPKHLLTFFNKPVPNEALKESTFLLKIKEIVENYRQVLEEGKSTIFKKAWAIRFEEVKTLEAQIRFAQDRGDDAQLFDLCTNIATQDNIYPLGFFSRNEFPDAIADALQDLTQGKLSVNLQGFIPQTELEKHYANLKKEVEELNKKLQTLEAQNLAHQSSAAISQVRNSNTYPSEPTLIPGLQNLHRSLDNALNDKRIALKKAEEKLNAFQQRYKETEVDNQILKQANKDLQQQNDTLQRANSFLEKKMEGSHIAQKFITLSDRIKQLQSERDQMLQSIKAYQTELATQKDSVSTHKQLLQAKDGEIADRQNKILQLQTYLASSYNFYNQELIKKKQEVGALQNQLSYKDNTSVERLKRIQFLETEIKQLNKQLKEKDLSLNKQISRIKELEKQLDINSRDNDSTNAPSSMNSNDMSQLKQLLEEREKELNVIRVREADLIQNFQAKENAFKNSLQQKEQQFEKLVQDHRTQLIEFEKRFAETKNELEKQLAQRDLRIEKLEAIVNNMSKKPIEQPEELSKGFSPSFP